MKPLILQIVLIVALGFLLMWLGYWWGVWLSALILGTTIPDKTGWAYVTGFIAGCLLWGLWSLYLNVQYGTYITPKMAAILQLGSAPSLLFITTLVGGILSLLGWSVGHLLRMVVKEKTQGMTPKDIRN